MADDQQDPIAQFSDALAARTAAAQGLVAAIRVHRGSRSGVLWRGDVVVASEQVFPKAEEAEVRLADGRALKARVAGRDPGTNIVALRLVRAVEAAWPAPAEPKLGALALAFSAGGDGLPSVRLGVVRSVGPAWHSLHGGLIDRRIALDLRLSRDEEGGPVLDARGELLGMSTAGPRGHGLVIPAATIERILEPLLTAGRVKRGWLGVALYPVALPEGAVAQSGQHRGLMVMQVAPEGPAAKGGVHPGDILLGVDGVAAARSREIGRGLGPESVGRTAELALLRAGAAMTVAVTITARP